MAERTLCGGCRASRSQLSTVLDLGTSPLADEFQPTLEGAIGLERYPLELLYCDRCTLVQLGHVVDDEVLWGGDYGFYSSASSVVVQHSRAYAGWLMSRFAPEIADGLTVEIASNDGVLLKPLKAAGASVLGIDPAAGPVANALAAGVDTWQMGFGRETAFEIVERRGEASLIVANNVIAHVADLDDFIGGIDILLADGGAAVLEFQYVRDLLTGNQFDHVYHEHRQFFSLTSLARALAPHDLYPVDVEENAQQGGSLRVVIDRYGDSETEAIHTTLRAEQYLDERLALGGLQLRAERIRERLRGTLQGMARDGLKVAGYGASAKSTTLLNFCGIGPELVPYFLDTTPTKIGRFTPGTGIPIVSPTLDSRMPDVHFLTVWNYLPEIIARERDFANRGGRWLVPIPAPVLI